MPFIVYSWVMHRTGTYRRLNLIFGFFPFIAAVLLAMMREDSHPVMLWISIVRTKDTLRSFERLNFILDRFQPASGTRSSCKPC